MTHSDSNKFFTERKFDDLRKTGPGTPPTRRGVNLRVRFEALKPGWTVENVGDESVRHNRIGEAVKHGEAAF